MHKWPCNTHLCGMVYMWYAETLTANILFEQRGIEQMERLRRYGSYCGCGRKSDLASLTLCHIKVEHLEIHQEQKHSERCAPHVSAGSRGSGVLICGRSHLAWCSWLNSEGGTLSKKTDGAVTVTKPLRQSLINSLIDKCLRCIN